MEIWILYSCIAYPLTNGRCFQVFRVKHFVREAEILREDVRTTIENATAKRASMSRKPGRISDDIVVPNLGGFLDCIELWYYATASDDSRTLSHFGQIGEANQDELIAENMVKWLKLSETSTYQH